MPTAPASGPGGGGGTFNGGTITDQLVVATVDPTEDALVVVADAADRAEGFHFPIAIQDENSHYLLQADQYGGLTVDGSRYNAGSDFTLGVTRRFRVFNHSRSLLLEILDPDKLGFFGTAAAVKPTVTGAKLPSDNALASLLTALAGLGLITDSTT